MEVGGLSEVGSLTWLVMKHPREAFIDDSTIDRQWRALKYPAAPDFARACDEYDKVVEIIRSAGAEITFLPANGATGLDSLYARDASAVCSKGVVLCRMGKPLRAAEPAAQAAAFRAAGMAIAGTIEDGGRLEGGDVVWLGARTVAIGQGYRTNAEGIRQFKEIAGNTIDETLIVPLPHWRGAADVMHLMSLISPVDRNLAVVYSPLMPVPFRQRLIELGYQLLEVPEGEFESMGSNVLALAPRKCLMLSGNPRTRELLQRAGAEVLEYEGQEISVTGSGGPTCLTRPLTRAD